MEHQFNTTIAKCCGIEESIILHNMYFWIKKNATNERHLHDGRYWTYNSVKSFSALFPYMSTSKIGRCLKKLQDEGFIVTGNYNTIAFDRTCWYAFSETGIALLSSNGYDCVGLSEDYFHEIGEVVQKEPKPRKKEEPKQELLLPYQSEQFVSEWNALKSSPKWKSKPESALQLSLNKLGKYEEEFAIEQMIRARESNWTGVVFSETDRIYNEWLNKKNGKSNIEYSAIGGNQYRKSSSDKESSRNALEELANSILGQY
ncbi:MAG: hypothetical protein GY755_13440 [Chloroflexi bacterium]|nr:hypothetical protein [Chloroflexota bacterium]